MDEVRDTLVSLNHAGVRMADKWLVRGVNMDICAGEIVTLIGPNGSGKSTTAKLALGVFDASEGEAHRKEDMRVSYVPQKLVIDWTMPLTVGRFMSLTHSAAKRDIETALLLTGTAHLIDAQVRNLSGGEFQRVLLARATINEPQLMVLDEPVQGVDFNGEIALYRLIEKIRTELNCGIILISHDLHVVMSSTDRVICLNGHVCCSGTPQAVASAPEFRTLFGDRAANELAFYQHNHDHEHLPDRTVRMLNDGKYGLNHIADEKISAVGDVKPDA
ncbi:MAG: ATP-binding cassette domain-containing protein [Alphaproteobacteria bacterium]|jgi:zinc transport system ATP-binding protein|nr:ATP-binding cassette domain-containing protein [Alphaproteobacteria bacterium]